MADYISREEVLEIICKLDRRSALIAGPKIVNMPAADVEPVRHGNWNIRLADELTLCLECSVCGRRVDNIDLHHLLEAGEYGEACKRYPYCHCVAKMILEGNR